MVDNPPKDTPRILPYLHYQNLEKALEWLTSVFGFDVSFTLPDKEGNLMHAEIKMADGVVMLGPTDKERGGLSPVDLPGVNQSLFVYVEDVDGHYRHARSKGADITMEPEEMFWGDRIYAVKDLEGHQWTFGQHVKEVAPEDIRPPDA